MQTDIKWFSAVELARILDITISAVNIKTAKYKWEFSNIKNTKGGGFCKKYQIAKLPFDIQTAIIEKSDIIDIAKIDVTQLCPEAQLTVARRFSSINDLSLIPSKPGTPPTIKYIRLNDDQARKARIIHEALNVPPKYRNQTRKWIELVGLKHGLSRSAVYGQIRKFKDGGLAGLKHTKSTKNQPKAWDTEALNYWVGLVLKRAHRKISRKKLYEHLQIEAKNQNWRIGSYKNALCWIKKLVTPQLEAFQKGGSRELDNILPPILRDYSDLKPFEIIVGDQHRFDFWVLDEETGTVFRPEGYLWQDLRARCLYGFALDKKYNAYLMGQALRIGIKGLGAFNSIYLDNGRPEESNYITGVLKEMEKLGLSVKATIDVPLNLSETSPEEINPSIIRPGTHVRAIVKNAKAKMIEGTFNVLEQILKNEFLVPGYVKRLTDLGERQDIDQHEAARLAKEGKLLTFMEFYKTVFLAMDFYNKEKSHLGVLREWSWLPKPKKATPLDCLQKCYKDGWRPERLSDDAIDLLFLPEVVRTVDKGRIRFDNRLYEHEGLIPLTTNPSTKVTIKYDPLDPGWLLVFHKDEYVCRAEPVEYSSMKDKNLASRKIKEKRSIRKAFIKEYRELTKGISDIRHFSEVPAIEKAAALVGKDKRKKAIENKELYRVPSEKEIENHQAEIDEIEKIRKDPPPPNQEKREWFSSDPDRYEYLVNRLRTNHGLSQEEHEFFNEYFLRWDEDGQRQFRQEHKFYGIEDKVAAFLDP